MNKQIIYNLDISKELEEIQEIREQNKKISIKDISRKKLTKQELDEIFNDLK